jgi:hypothetical protein
MSTNPVSEAEEGAVRRVMTATAKVLQRELREVSDGDRVVLLITLPPGRQGRVHALGDFENAYELRNFLEYVLANMDREKSTWNVP